MPKTQRTPPRPIENESNLHHSKSDSDLSLTEEGKSTPKLSPRAKRPRVDDSPKNDFYQFKNEIKCMLHSWNKEQNKEIKELLTSWKGAQLEEIKHMFATWRAEQDTALSKLSAEINELKLQNLNTQKLHIGIQQSINSMNSEHEHIKRQIESLERNNKEYSENINRFETEIQEIKRSSRSSSIEVRNVPEFEKETRENLLTVLSSIGKTLNITIQPQELRDIYRIPGKPGRNRTIIAELNNVEQKDLILSSVRAYNKLKSTEEKISTTSIGIPGARLPIYISEYLPSTTKKLYYLAREYAKGNNYEFCWVVNGKVLLRKRSGDKTLHIKSEHFLLNLDK